MESANKRLQPAAFATAIIFKDDMNINRHHNLVNIFQFLGMSAFILTFFMSLDFLKQHDAFNPALFILGPVVSAFLARIIMILCFPPACKGIGCNGSMILNIVRNRRYSCNSCSSTVLLKKLKYDPAYRKRVSRLMIIFGLIVLILVSLAIAGIVRNSS